MPQSFKLGAGKIAFKDTELDPFTIISQSLADFGSPPVIFNVIRNHHKHSILLPLLL